MPLIVDHDKRRAVIADIVKEMIAETGIDSVTVRAVARKAGYSSTILSHYFRDKQHLLLSAFGSVLSETPVRVQTVMDAGGDLLECISALLPITESNLRDWQAWFGFWGKVTHDPALAEERLIGIEETNRTLMTILDYAVERGELSKDIDKEFHANGIQIFLNGIAAMVTTQPDVWPKETQQVYLRNHIHMMKTLPAGLQK
ncbi:TetR/AcrR family transcriptional regulator [Croceicoccus sp. BE223]|uniref:TetR/AcrR family transcriptional regulator n=1 Tax=Croceicoccus sp. BE223 TaxID=2817716 RepID=UPI00285B7153|nr:TetR/AcrR family transcriptional regulator [Croceicoccus sp. BE223]MDR7102395.1 AcrR family transcriptional regulator [Croceicoccus sp. BE223]